MTAPALVGLLLYLAAVGSAAVLARRGAPKARDIRYEAFGARHYGALVLGIFVAASMLGPADALALSQQGRSYGMIWALFPMGAALAQVVAGWWFIPRIHRAFGNSVSLGDVLEARCHVSARWVAGTVVAVQSVAFSGVLILGGGQLLAQYLGLQLTLGMAATALVVAAYTGFGGFAAVLATSRVQFLLVATVLAAVLIGVTQELSAALATDQPVLVRGSFVADHPWPVALNIFLAYFLGELLLPAYSMRSLIASSAPKARGGFLIAAAILILWYSLMTMAGALDGAAARTATSAVPLFGIVERAGGPWVTALLFAGLLSLVHSTFDSFLNIGATAFARDTVGSIFHLDDARQGSVARRATFVIAGAGIAVAVVGGGLIDILLLGYTIWVPTLLAPWAWLALRPQHTFGVAGFWGALSAGVAVWGVCESLEETWMPSLLAGLLANLTVLTADAALRRGRQ